MTLDHLRPHNRPFPDWALRRVGDALLDCPIGDVVLLRRLPSKNPSGWEVRVSTWPKAEALAIEELQIPQYPTFETFFESWDAATEREYRRVVVSDCVGDDGTWLSRMTKETLSGGRGVELLAWTRACAHRGGIGNAGEKSGVNSEVAKG
jgi:hypothetical protein